MSDLPILIAGGGIGGLAAACGLAQKGFRSIVFEQAPELGEIGAGFYQFGKSKQHHYNKARSALGQMLALLDAYPEQGLEKAKQFIGDECLPALGSLMRKLERNSLGERSK